ncbi:MAG: BON domain-containing protein [Verrucomicrobiota bacterium]
MKKTLILTTLAAGFALVGCNKSTRTDTAAVDPAPVTTEPTVGQRVDAAAQRTGDAIADAGRATRDAANNAGSKMRTEWTEWKLSHQDLDADLRADRPIIRTRTIPAGAPTGVVNVDKSQLKNNVKANVSQHAAAIKDLDVEIDNETEVVLTGKAMSSGDVAAAIGSALSTDGITKVTSKIKLDQ